MSVGFLSICEACSPVHVCRQVCFLTLEYFINLLLTSMLKVISSMYVTFFLTGMWQFLSRINVYFPLTAPIHIAVCIFSVELLLSGMFINCFREIFIGVLSSMFYYLSPENMCCSPNWFIRNEKIRLKIHFIWEFLHSIGDMHTKKLTLIYAYFRMNLTASVLL